MNRKEREEYYLEQEYRGEVAARFVVIAWIFLAGAVAGYVLAGVVG